MLTFPSLVPPQKLEAVSPPLKTGEWFKLHFSTLPHKKPNKPKHIQVPEQGSFELTLQPGPEFKLLDANAGDGLAVVQVPADVYQGYLRLAGEPATTGPRSLEYEDPLYYVKHTLGRNDNEPRLNQSFTLLAQNPDKLQLTSRCSPEPESHRIWQVHNPTAQPVPYTWEIKDSDQEGSEVAPPGDSYLETQTEESGKNALVLKVNGQKQDSLASKRDRCAPGQEPSAQTSKWWNLGSHALPTPPSWNLQQNGYTLKLKNQGITDFTVRLVRRPAEQAALPLGMKEIGPAGGTVELPGVARLEIPAGALSENKMVKLSQLLQVPSRKWLCVNPNDPNDCDNGYVFATPIVKLEPLGLDLNQHAKLYTDLFPQYANTRFPFQRGTLTPENPLSWNFGYLGVREEITSLDQLRPNDFILVKTFAYIAKEESYPGWEPPQSAQPHFRVQAQEPSGRVIINKDFIIEAKTNDIEAGALENAAGYLQVAYDHFTSEFVGLKPPLKWEPENAPTHLRKIPVHLHPQLYVKGQPASGTASRPVFCDSPTAQAKCKPEGTLIKLTTCRPFCDFHSPEAADTSIHELFHAFQMGYASKSSELPGPDDNWFIEGSAALVGPWVLSQKASTLQLAFDAKELIYQDRVTSIDTLFVPFVTRETLGTPGPYETVSFWGHLGLTHTLDIVFDLLKEYGINQKQKTGVTPRINRALHTIIQRKNSNNSLDLAYKHFAQDALFKQNLQVFESSDFRQDHVNLIKTPPISTQQTSTTPLLIDQSIDSLATKYILLTPSPDLPDNSVLKVRFKSIDKREAYPNGPASPIQVLDYLKPQLIGIQNPEGQGVLREGNQDIVQKVGDFLPIEFEQEITLENFGPHSASKSAVLIIPNALWQLDSNYPIKPVFEVYTNANPLPPIIHSITPEAIHSDSLPVTFTLHGENLQQLKTLKLGSTFLPVLSATSTSLTARLNPPVTFSSYGDYFTFIAGSTDVCSAEPCQLTTFLFPYFGATEPQNIQTLVVWDPSQNKIIGQPYSVDFSNNNYAAINALLLKPHANPNNYEIRASKERCSSIEDCPLEPETLTIPNPWFRVWPACNYADPTPTLLEGSEFGRENVPYFIEFSFCGNPSDYDFFMVFSFASQTHRQALSRSRLSSYAHHRLGIDGNMPSYAEIYYAKTYPYAPVTGVVTVHLELQYRYPPFNSLKSETVSPTVYPW